MDGEINDSETLTSNKTDYTPPNNRKYGYHHLFIYKSLRKSSLGFMGMLFGLQYIYFGGQYNLTQITRGGNSVYLIGALVGIGEVIVYWICE